MFFRTIGNLVLGAALPLAAAALAAPALGQDDTPNPLPKEIEGIDEVRQNLGAQLPLDLRFRDEEGREVTLGDYCNGEKPVLFTFNYFRCPSLCGYQLQGLLECLRNLTWVPGDEFRIVTISFEPLEGPELAAAKKRNFIGELGKSSAARGWHFLTGKPESIRAVLDTVGMTVRWNEKRQEWAHAAVLVVASPGGKITRYFGGTYYEPDTVRLSLVEASAGKVGSLWDRVFLICFHYVSEEGKYALAAKGVMKIGGALFVVVLSLTLIGFWRADRRRARWTNSPALPASGAPRAGDGGAQAGS